MPSMLLVLIDALVANVSVFRQYCLKVMYDYFN
jgi:hypothetical protein